ncbi:hypothetical protein D3C87_1927310 [compost metagenome]
MGPDESRAAAKNTAPIIMATVAIAKAERPSPAAAPSAIEVTTITLLSLLRKHAGFEPMPDRLN